MSGEPVYTARTIRGTRMPKALLRAHTSANRALVREARELAGSGASRRRAPAQDLARSAAGAGALPAAAGVLPGPPGRSLPRQAVTGRCYSTARNPMVGSRYRNVSPPTRPPDGEPDTSSRSTGRTPPTITRRCSVVPLGRWCDPNRGGDDENGRATPTDRRRHRELQSEPPLHEEARDTRRAAWWPVATTPRIGSASLLLDWNSNLAEEARARRMKRRSQIGLHIMFFY
jgi:hypothetical protein